MRKRDTASGSEDLSESGMAERPHERTRRRRRPTLPFRIFMWLLLLLAIVSLSAYVLYHRWLADPENVRAFAEHKLALLFPGKKVAVGSAEFSLFGGLDLFEVRVAEGEDEIETARLNQVHIDFDLGGLTNFTLLIKNVSATDLFLDLIRTSDGKWNLVLPASGAGSSQTPFATPFTVSLRGAFLSIDDQKAGYAISFPVDRASAISESRDFNDWRVAADFGGGLIGKWRLAAKGNVADKSLDAEVKVLDIDLGKGLRTRMPPEARRIYDKFEPSGLADLSARIERPAGGAWDFEVRADLKSCGARYYRFPVATGDIYGTLRFTPEGVFYDGLTAFALGGKVSMSGKNVGYGPEAAVDITFQTVGLRPDEELLAALPESAARVVKAFDPEGPFDATVEMKRAAGPERPVDVSTDIRPQGISVTYDRFPLTINNVRGKIIYTRGSLLVSDLTGSRGDMQIFAGGNVDSFGRDADIRMRVVATQAPFEERIRVLLPKPSADFWKSCAPEGTADAEVTLSKTESGPLETAVSIRLHDVSAFYSAFPYRLTGGAGEFTIAGGTWTSEDGLSFHHGAGTVKIAGEADVATGAADLKITTSRLSVDADLESALPEAWADRLRRLRLTGECDAALLLARDSSGEVSVPEINAQVRGGSLLLRDMPIGIGQATTSARITPEILDVKGFNGWLFPDNSLALMPFVRLAYLGRPAAHISADGSLGLTKADPSWEVGLDLGDLFVGEPVMARLQPDLREVLADRRLNGFTDVSGYVERYRETGGTTTYDLAVDCQGTSIFFGKRFSGLAGHVDLKGDYDSSASIFVAKGRLAGFDFADTALGKTAFTLEKSDGDATLHSFDTEALGGRIRGKGRVALPPGVGYALEVTFDRLALEEVLDKVLGYSKEGLTGTMSGSAGAICLTGDSADLVGSCETTVKEGALWEVPVVLAIFNVLNLKIPERSQFTEAHINCNFADGRIMVNEFSLAGDPATIVGKGTIGFDGTIEMTFYAQPGRIPVISLIAGEVGRNIVVAHATGSFASPKVTLKASGPFGALLDMMSKPFKRKER